MHTRDATDAVAIVAGGSFGTGREIARELASRGCAVVIVYVRDQPEAEAAVEEILAAGGAALAIRADVEDALDVERVFDETDAAFGGVDAVVHTAVRGARVLDLQAARRLRPGGTIAGSDAIAPGLARELCTRGITIAALEPPRAGHRIADLLVDG